MLHWARSIGFPIIHTCEGHRPDLSDLPANKRWPGHRRRRAVRAHLGARRPGWNIIPELTPLPGETIIDKPVKGMFHDTRLHQRLQAASITHLVFTGVTTEVRVQSSMREANDRGYECLVVEDARESYFPEFKDATLAMITAQGAIVGWSTRSEVLMDALRQTA